MPDGASLFGWSVPPLELVVRGSAMYWFLFLLFRFPLRRDTGSVGMADVLLMVVIADASQNAMAGEYSSISDGCLLIATIAGWSLVIDRLALRSPRLRRFFEPPPVVLIRDGQVLVRNLRRELMSKDDLLAQLRHHGLDDPSQVREARLESDGQVSVVRYPERE